MRISLVAIIMFVLCYAEAGFAMCSGAFNLELKGLFRDSHTFAKHSVQVVKVSERNIPLSEIHPAFDKEQDVAMIWKARTGHTFLIGGDKRIDWMEPQDDHDPTLGPRVKPAGHAAIGASLLSIVRVGRENIRKTEDMQLRVEGILRIPYYALNCVLTDISILRHLGVHTISGPKIHARDMFEDVLRNGFVDPEGHYIEGQKHYLIWPDESTFLPGETPLKNPDAIISSITREYERQAPSFLSRLLKQVLHIPEDELKTRLASSQSSTPLADGVLRFMYSTEIGDKAVFDIAEHIPPKATSIALIHVARRVEMRLRYHHNISMPEFVRHIQTQGVYLPAVIAADLRDTLITSLVENLDCIDQPYCHSVALDGLGFINVKFIYEPSVVIRRPKPK